MAKKTSKALGTGASSSKKTTKKKLSKKKTSKKATPAKKATTTKKATTARTAKSAKKATPAKASTRKSTKTKSASASKSDNGKKTVTLKTPKKGKSPYSKRELTKYRNILLIKRAEIRGDMDSMQAEALLNHDSANLSHMPIHMADVGSDQYDQELTLGLVESERRLLNEIEEALARLEEGTYGICEVSGEPINKARLEAKPWAKYTIEVAREMERNGSRR